MKTVLLFPVMLALVVSACKKDDYPVDQDTIQVTIKNSDTYTYSTGIGGDEEGAKIIRQAQNFKISELRRNKSTNWVVYYNYEPKPRFKGKEYVEIETYEGSNGAIAPSVIKKIKILITVTR